MYITTAVGGDERRWQWRVLREGRPRPRRCLHAEVQEEDHAGPWPSAEVSERITQAPDQVLRSSRTTLPQGIVQEDVFHPNCMYIYFSSSKKMKMKR